MMPKIGEIQAAFLSRTGKVLNFRKFRSKKTVVLQRKNQLFDAGKW